MEAPATPGSFGPYEIRRPLGVGGMAETSVAVRRGPGGFEQHVCLKRILPAFSSDPRFVGMFLSEARLAAKLRHTNVVQVYDFGEHAGAYYLALELIDGTDLRKLLRWVRGRGEKLDVEQVVFIAYELLAALSYAHKLTIDGTPAGLVHRDVTPSNVLISCHGEVKLADFGIAKATESTAATQSGSVKGKIPYMSPEQAAGGRVDARTDLFALGVVIYELLTSYRPFDGANDTATLMNLARGKYRPLRTREPETPATLEHVVDRLLAHDPDDRFNKADDVSDALAELVPSPAVRRKLGALADEFVSSREVADEARSGPGDRGPAERKSNQTASGVRPTASESVPEDPLPANPTLALEPDDVPHSPPLALAARTSTSKVPRRLAAMGVGAVVALILTSALWWTTQSSTGSSNPSSTPERPDVSPAERARQNSTPRTTPSAGDRGTGPDPVHEGAPRTETPPPIRAHHEAGRGEPETPPEEAAGAARRIRQASERRRRATLEIQVVPWGNVWIDGRPHGRAPVVARLLEGSHTVAVGRDAPEHSRRVRLQSGQSRTLRMEVSRERLQ